MSGTPEDGYIWAYTPSPGNATAGPWFVNPDGPEAAAQLDLYEAALRGIVGNANEAMPMGPFDCIDNDGEPYQSAALERALKVGRDLLARTLNSTDTGA